MCDARDRENKTYFSQFIFIIIFGLGTFTIIKGTDSSVLLLLLLFYLTINAIL